MKESRARALFELADIPITAMYRIENEYWPDNEHYNEVRHQNPWWLAITPFGPIRIGRRKRVWSIAWPQTKARVIVTEDEVTKDETLVYADTILKCLEYLLALSAELQRVSPIASEETA